jgi:hypothetical protein
MEWNGACVDGLPQCFSATIDYVNISCFNVSCLKCFGSIVLSFLRQTFDRRQSVNILDPSI